MLAGGPVRVLSIQIPDKDAFLSGAAVDDVNFTMFSFWRGRREEEHALAIGTFRTRIEVGMDRVPFSGGNKSNLHAASPRSQRIDFSGSRGTGSPRNGEARNYERNIQE